MKKLTSLTAFVALLLVGACAFSAPATGSLSGNSKTELNNLSSSHINSLSNSGYVWFDLGNVLVETREGFGNLHWMPGVYDHLQELFRRGFQVGLITNIPEKWGNPGDKASKIAKLQEVINSGWTDDNPFDISIFSEVLLPLYKSQSKPAALLFQQAISISQAENRIPIFEGESPAEVEAAIANGMLGHLVVYETDGKTPILKPIDELPQ